MVEIATPQAKEPQPPPRAPPRGRLSFELEDEAAVAVEAVARVLAELRFPADRVVISAMACVPVKALQRLVASVTDKLLRVRARGAIVGRFGFDARGDTTSSAVTMYRIEDGTKQVHPVITLPAGLLWRR